MRREGSPKNVNFYKVETVSEGGLVVIKRQKLVNVACEWPLMPIPMYWFQTSKSCVIQGFGG